MSRYLLFIALEFSGSETEFSWIESFLDKEGLKKTFYTDLVPELFDEKEYKPFTTGEFKVSPEKAVNRAELQLPLIFTDFLAEHEFCPKRFMYSYILNRHSTFDKDFILKNFLFTQLLRVIRYHCNFNEEKAFNEAIRLFPQWNVTTMRSIGNRSMKIPLSPANRIVYKNLSIPESRRRFIFPGSKKEEIEKYYRSDGRDIVEDVLKMNLANNHFKKSDEANCTFCPYSERCNEVELSGGII